MGLPGTDVYIASAMKRSLLFSLNFHHLSLLIFMPVDGMSAYKKGLNKVEKEQFDKNWDLIFKNKSNVVSGEHTSDTKNNKEKTKDSDIS